MRQALRIHLLAVLSLLNLAAPTFAEGPPDHRGGHDFHFVLVHGGGHGAWCWYKVISLLRRRGHSVYAPDLVSAGMSNVDPKQVSSLDEYSAPVIEFLASLPRDSKTVLVGHSLGGASLTYLLEKFPEKILAAVYVAALMLPSGPSAATINNQLLALALQSASDYSLKDLLYGLSPSEDVVLGTMLYKASPCFNPTVNYTRANYGRVPRYFIKTRYDNVLPSEQQDILIRKTPPSGVFELNSDHSPFFSAPEALVRRLLQIAKSESKSNAAR